MQNEIDIALPSLAPFAERVPPAVVNISAALKEQAAAQGDENTENQSASPLGPGGTPFDQFLKRFFEQPLRFRSPAEKMMALGSGFIIDPTGYIVPHNHVVANACKVTVIFQDDSRHAAKVIGRDEKADIALLKIDTNQHLTYVTSGRAMTPRSAIGWSRSANVARPVQGTMSRMRLDHHSTCRRF